MGDRPFHDVVVQPVSIDTKFNDEYLVDNIFLKKFIYILVPKIEVQNTTISDLRLSCRELEIVPKDNLSINVNISPTLIVGLRMILEK